MGLQVYKPTNINKHFTGGRPPASETAPHLRFTMPFVAGVKLQQMMMMSWWSPRSQRSFKKLLLSIKRTLSLSIIQNMVIHNHLYLYIYIKNKTKALPPVSNYIFAAHDWISISLELLYLLLFVSGIFSNHVKSTKMPCPNAYVIKRVTLLDPCVCVCASSCCKGHANPLCIIVPNACI